MKLRVWWIPQVPMPAFYAEVRSLREARLLLTTLARYDLFQFEHRVKPDFCNTGGLQGFDPDGSWSDWYDEDGRGIDELTDVEINELDAAESPR